MKNKIYKLLSLLITLLIFNSTFNIKNCKSQWVQCNGIWGGSIIYSLVSGNYIFAGTNGNGVYISSNNGQNWTQTSLNNHFISSLAISGNTVVAGLLDGGVYISSNNGQSWTQTSLMTGYACYAVGISGNYIFAGVNAGLSYCCFISSNNGVNWWNPSCMWDSPPHAFVTSGNKIYAGAYGTNSGVYLSINNGLSWLSILSPGHINALAVNGNTIIAGFYAVGVYLSTNEGVNWSLTSLNNQNVYSVAISGNNIIAGADTGVYVSTIYGSNWIKRNEGFPAGIRKIFALCIANGYIFAGTDGSSVWKRPLTEVIGIKPISSKIPDKYSLLQNYPNPFNPTTNIEFTIPKTGLVKLTVFDLNGRELAALVNEVLKVGKYSVDFNANNLSSGVYFYKLQANDFVQTKKMIIIK